MSAPTQALPSWLTYSTSLITGAGGSVLTSSTLLELPLTYYGPSIPLGTDGVWTYGGLTSPASTSTASTLTATPSSLISTTTSTPSSTSISATPSSSISTTTSTPSSTSISATPSSSISTTTSTPSSTSFSATPSSSLSPSSTTSQPSSTLTVYTTTTPLSTSTAHPSPTAALSKGTIIGIILGSILGSLLFLVLGLLFLRWRRRRQNGGYQTPIWTGWEIVDPTPVESQENVGGSDEDRPPGEGSPRGSGDETDSFLRRSRTTDSGITPMAGTSTRLVTVPPAAAAGATAVASTAAAVRRSAAAGTVASGSNSGTNNSGGSGPTNTESTVVSDYGILLHGSDYTDDPEGFSPTHIPARPSTDLGFISDSRYMIPPSELLRIERERLEQEQLMHNEPRTSRNITMVPGYYSPLVPPPQLDPDRLGFLSSSPKPSSSAMSGASGNDQDDPMVLTARRVRLTQLGPRSQPELRLQSTPGTSSSVWGSLGLGGISRLSRLSWFRNFRENLQDSPASPPSRRGSRPASWVPRPLSTHDVEGARALLDDDLKPPRALGVTEEGERPRSSISARSGVSGSTVYHDAESAPGTPPPLPTLPRAHMSGGDTTTTADRSYGEPPVYESEPAKDDNHAPRLVDVLDMPAPAPTSQFSSASSRSVQFPPGLVTLQSPQSWYESSSSDGSNAGITIDVLEDTPPRAGDGWRALARNATLSHPSDHRTSFGIVQFARTHDLAMISEIGSLHSMRSHLNPLSARSSGSAPASSRHTLTGSNSSRPSAYSHGLTSSSGHSLAHSGSISSDDRRRTRGAVSPALSAFGDGHHFPSPPPYVPRRESTVIARTSNPNSFGTETTYTNSVAGRVADQTTGDSELFSMPWATGLD